MLQIYVFLAAGFLFAMLAAGLMLLYEMISVERELRKNRGQTDD